MFLKKKLFVCLLMLYRKKLRSKYFMSIENQILYTKNKTYIKKLIFFKWQQILF